jgi:hypothetical protein
MKAKSKKWVHAGVTGLVAGVADISTQLATGTLVNAPRAMIVGIGVGIVARALGAALAAMSTSDEESDGATG